MIGNKKLYISCAICLVLAIAIYVLFAARSKFVETTLQKKIEDFEKSIGCDIGYEGLDIEGISLFTIKDMVVYTPQKDTFLSISSLKTQLNPIALLHGDKQLNFIDVENMKLNIIHTQKRKNYKFLTDAFSSINTKQTKNKDVLVSDSSSLFEKVTRQTKKIAQFHNFLTKVAPKDISIKNWDTQFVSDSMNLTLHFPESKMSDRDFFTQIVLQENLSSDSTNIRIKNKYYIIRGHLGQKTSEESELKVYSLNEKPASLPFLRDKINTFLSFDTLKFAIASQDKPNKEICLSGSVACLNSTFFNPKFASDTILNTNALFKFNTIIKNDTFEIDSSSVIEINGLPAHPHMTWENHEDGHIISIDLKTPKFESEKLFSSIPDGICPHLKGIKTSGNFSYDLHFKIDTKQIDSLEFSSSLTPENFNIIRFGATDFRKANNAFTHLVLEDGEEKRSILLSEENPNYVCTDQVSPYLTNSILISEDGLFFHHKGFLESALRASIIKNIKEKKFARGGSTLSMQLVKNLWLSKEKTLARKFEEALIVWLIENERLISKERMFEIYLNIIEWGPNVYGAKEAALFYFDKEPDMLSIEEAIFMTSIIPKPKKFKWSFDKNQNLKPYLADYYKLIASKLLKREIISAKDTAQLIPNVKLTGKAKFLLKKEAGVSDSDKNEEAQHLEAFDNLILQVNNEDFSNPTN